MIRRTLQLAAASLLWLALSSPLPAAAPEDARRATRYDQEIAAFAAADRAQPPVRDGILFVGSSIFRRWENVAGQLAPLPVLNRAFGGSRSGDQLDRFEQVVAPYTPRVIVYYCGSNDINAGRSAPEIAANFRAFVGRVHATRPATRIFHASILRAPQKRDRWEVVDTANRLVREFCATDPRLGFVDLNPAVFDAHGQPRLELYLEDRLHYRPAAYDGFAAILRPVLERAWREVSAPPGRRYAYQRDGGDATTLEVFFPPGHEPGRSRAPAILLFHGGGWSRGTLEQFRQACAYFAGRGLVAATANYRMHTKDQAARLPPGESFKRLCVADARRALRWLKQQSRELGLDPARIVVGGGSAGGHIAVLATINPGRADPADSAGVDTTVAAYVLFNPAFAAGDTDPEVIPGPYLNRGFATAIAFFGTEDRWQPGWRAVQQQLAALGHTASELWLARGLGHGFYLEPPWDELTLAAADRFLVRLGLLAGEPALAAPAGGQRLERAPGPSSP